MADELRWVLGLQITMGLTIGGALLAAFYRLSDGIKKGDEALHIRMNDMRDNYVRRTDLDGHLARIDLSVRDMRGEMREQHRDTQNRIDSVLAALKDNPQGK